MAERVRIEGLRELRRDLRQLGKEEPRQLSLALKESVAIAARTASLLAPRRTGALAASYKPFTRGTTAGIRSRLEYAAVHEYGGTIHPRNTIEIQRSLPVTRAIMRERDNLVDDIGDRIEATARRNGWNQTKTP